MDETLVGVRDRRGNWTPNRKVTTGPLFEFPPKLGVCARWLFGYPGYFAPWNLTYFGIAVGAWLVATPSRSTTTNVSAGWILLVLVRNMVIVGCWFGAFHVRLYRQRRQDTRFKFNGRWPASESSQFTFGSQIKDNMWWTLASGVPIWTAYEVLSLWMFSAGHLAWMDLRQNPIWFVALLLLIPLIRDLHFYWVHRAIHWPPIYKRVHSLHHRNTNPGPWSGLSMHPLEHLFYFSGVLVHWVLPSHPLHAMFHLFHAGLAPAPGHTGFERIELSESKSMDTNGFAHYLHHKYFEVNYSDGAIPLDRWFGSFHDGSPEANEAMKARRAARRHPVSAEE